MLQQPQQFHPAFLLLFNFLKQIISKTFSTYKTFSPFSLKTPKAALVWEQMEAVVLFYNRSEHTWKYFSNIAFLNVDIFK